MAKIRLFASIREVAGCGYDEIPGTTLGEVLETACERYGHDFAEMMRNCQIWHNGETASLHTHVNEQDEIAILPPVSGGF